MKRFSLVETGLWRHLREVVCKFAEDNCLLIAAAISFFALLSVLPLMLLAVAILGEFVSSSRAQEFVLQFASDQLPGLEDQVAQQLKDLVNSHRLSGVVGLVGLLWASGQVFLNMEVALNLAWHAHQRRSVFHRRLLSLVMTVLAGVPLGLSVILTIAITTLRRLTVPILGWRLGQIPFIWTLLGESVPVLLAVASFSAVYRWVPNRPVRWRAALSGGVVGGLLWELAKRVFAFYAAEVGHFGGIYGPFAGIVGLMLWIYYSALILLLGAEIGAVTQSVHPIAPHLDTAEAQERLREIDSAGV